MDIRFLGWAAVASMVGLALLGPGAATVGAANVVPGNNGTVKVDGNAFTNGGPDNDPHLGCTFYVEWFSFDSAVTSTVTFTIQPPSGQFDVLLTDQFTLSDNGQQGAGHAFDGQKLYDLGGLLSSYFYQPEQGYHVELTIDTPHSNGADNKHKVFWVTGCGVTTSTSTTSTGTTSTGTTSTGTTSTGTTSTGTTSTGTTSTGTTSTGTTSTGTTSTSTSTTTSPTGAVSAATGAPSGGVQGVTGTPKVTPPSTNTMDGTPAGNTDGYRIILLGLAVLLATVLLTQPRSVRSRD
ncbi:MAG: hypothetical protein ACYDCI_06160 [Candidatus Limnocylindrales bacterium]